MTAGARTPASLTGRRPDGYERHALHAPTRAYAESNCYADVIVELLHARGLQPLAMFGHLVRMDFEGDQWTFFKPPPEDVERLFAVDIHEMQPYRPLPVQMAEQVAAGRTMIVELDSFYMPDTAATSYRANHVKSSVAVDAIDPDAELLHYFHGPGFWELSGEDYRGIFRLDGPEDPTVLPPYTELVRFDAGSPLTGAALTDGARAILSGHLRRAPGDNPFVRFGDRLREALPELLAGDLETFHAYAFATVRMAGSAFEILADHARWLAGEDAAEVAEACGAIVDGCKALSFRLARRRPFEPAATVDGLAAAWERTLTGLRGLAA